MCVVATVFFLKKNTVATTCDADRVRAQIAQERVTAPPLPATSH